VLYWLLNERRLPFLPLPPAKLSATMEDAARNRRFSGTPLPEPANGSKKFKAIVLKACAFNPSDRYHTADEMLKDLLEMGAGHGLRGVMPNATQPNVGMLAQIEEERLRQIREDEEAKRRDAEAQALERQKAEEQERLRREREELERLRREREALEAQRRQEEEAARLQREQNEQERLKREREALEAQRRQEEEKIRLRREREEQERLRQTQQNLGKNQINQAQNAGDAHRGDLLNDLALMRGECIESEQVRRERDEAAKKRQRLAEEEEKRKRTIDELTLMRAEREVHSENKAETVRNETVASQKQSGKMRKILMWSGIAVAAVLLVVVLTYPLWRCSVWGHVWRPATVSSPDTCRNCGKTEGYSLPFDSTIKSLSVAPQKTFFVGDRLSVDDFSVVAIYTNGLNRKLLGTFTIDVKELKKAGNQPIAISYGDVTIYYTIYVHER